MELCTTGHIKAASKVFVEVLSQTPTTVITSRDSYFLSRLWLLWAELHWSLDENTACLHTLKVALQAQWSYAGSDLRTIPYTLSATGKLQLLRALRKHAQTKPCFVHTYALGMVQHILQREGHESVTNEMHLSIQVFKDALSYTDDPTRTELAYGMQRFVVMAKSKKHKSHLHPDEEWEIGAMLVRQFPHDTTFLYQLATLKQLERVGQQLRAIIEEEVIPAKCVRPIWGWLLGLRYMVEYTSSSRIRSFLDQALLSHPREALLWHLAIDYEVRQSQANRLTTELKSRVKALAFQALRYCPYDKGTRKITNRRSIATHIEGVTSESVYRARFEHDNASCGRAPTPIIC